MEASDRPAPGPDDPQAHPGAGRPGGIRPGPWWWVGAAVVAIGLGVGGYFLGKSTGEDDVRAEYQHVVSVSPGKTVPYVVTQRTLMKTQTYYARCTDNSAAICTTPFDQLQPVGSGGASGG